MSAREIFSNPHAWTAEEHSRRMLKKARLLTHPTRRAETRLVPSEAAAEEQGAYSLGYVEDVQGENEAGGLFQHPAKASRVLTVRQQPEHGYGSHRVRDSV